MDLGIKLFEKCYGKVMNFSQKTLMIRGMIGFYGYCKY